MTVRRSVWAVSALVALFAGASPPDQEGKPWAFQPVVRPPVPNAAHATNPIDAFLDRGLSADGLKPAPEADRRTLIRRLTLDLLGLPPTPDEVRAFLADTRPDAYERLVDRLLDSPQYGERWARHWLDLVRFAETHGYERDDPKPNAWKYRDWVVAAINRDLPYDRFLTEQLAGDELPDATDASRTATGMYRLGPIDDEPADPVMDRFDQLDDMVKTVGTTMLGLTIHCARCHDHKFDPIKQSDYYRMLAFLTPSKRYVRGQDESISVILASDSERVRVAELEKAVKRQVARLNARIEELRIPHRKAVAGMPGDETALADARLSPGEKAIKKECESSIARLERYRPVGLPMVLGLTDVDATAPATHLMVRGDAHRPGKAIEPGFLSKIEPTSPTIDPPPAAEDDRATARARPLADPAGQPADGAGDGQPPLAAPLRPRAGRHPQRLRLDGRGAERPGIALLARLRVRREGLEPQGHASPDRDERGLSAIRGLGRRRGRDRPGQSSGSGGSLPAAWKPSRSGTPSSPSPAA